jgi:hypothetical protein
MNEIVLQVGTTFFTALSIWLISMNNKWSKWGFVVGVVAQCFWTIVYITTQQHLLHILGAWYFYCYIKGIRNHWSKK